ncbi:hypothetical protein RRG08_025054 [Elysia crispata]|uniref:Uncharacterized protein n=1 Tax=Elysia crispata TaxID=231223 RepID=A0AAE1E0G9_9GAST|nr:hypothetical protein RRG08_025054 [Elysia crispata]
MSPRGSHSSTNQTKFHDMMQTMQVLEDHKLVLRKSRWLHIAISFEIKLIFSSVPASVEWDGLLAGSFFKIRSHLKEDICRFHLKYLPGNPKWCRWFPVAISDMGDHVSTEHIMMVSSYSE